MQCVNILMFLTHFRGCWCCCVSASDMGCHRHPCLPRRAAGDQPRLYDQR